MAGVMTKLQVCVLSQQVTGSKDLELQSTSTTLFVECLTV